MHYNNESRDKALPQLDGLEASLNPELASDLDSVQKPETDRTQLLRWVLNSVFKWDLFR